MAFYLKRTSEVQTDIEVTYHCIVNHVPTLDNKYKKPFAREWANEDGTDIYIPAVRKKKAYKVVITVTFKEATFLDDYNNLVNFMAEKEFEYFDDVQSKKFNGVFENASVIKRDIPNNFIQANFTILNKDGAVTNI